MSEFALIFNGTVAQLAPAEFSVNPAMTWLDVTAVSPAPQPGWTYAGGMFTAPGGAPAPTLVQMAAAALSAGLAITSTGTSALSGTYAVDQLTQDHVQSEMISLLASGGTAFADGSASVAWPDMAGGLHTFSLTEFRAFALAIGAYVAALYKCINGTLSTLPAATATIA